MIAEAGNGQDSRTNTKPPFLFTVVLPVFNRAQLVRAAINSVLVQDCNDFELIVVDDGSTDDISAAVSTFRDPRIRFVRQTNMGASAARNHGIALAHGRYIAFLDSDDTFMPHHLSTMRDLLQGRSMCVGYSQVLAQRGVSFIIRPPRAIAAAEHMATYLMCRRGFVQTSGLVVPAEAARSVRYREDVIFGDDTDFAVRLALAGYRFVMSASPSVIWFDGPDPARLSNSPLSAAGLKWLEDLRPKIPVKAYLGYRGWHVAKGLFKEKPLRALNLYLHALFAAAYGPRLALIILLQIVLPGQTYRGWSDTLIKLRYGRADARLTPENAHDSPA